MLSFKKRLSLCKGTFTSGIVIFTMIIVLLLLKTFYPSASQIASFRGDSQTEFDKLVEKESSSINDSLPHYLFKQKQDSVRRELFDDYTPSGSSWSAGGLGVEKLEPKKGENKYYLLVDGYFVERSFWDFYSLHGKNYLEYAVYTKEKDYEQSGDLHTIETNLRIKQLNEKEWQISYPQSKTRYTIWEAIVIVLSFIMIGIFFIAIVGLPIQFLSLIAQGKAFSEKVIVILNTIAAILIFGGILRAILRVSLHLYYKAQMPPSITFYYYDDFMSGWGLIVGGLIALLVATAFKRGYELQQEQELTV